MIEPMLPSRHQTPNLFAALLLTLLTAWEAGPFSRQALAQSGKVEIDFVEKDSEEPIECRVKILDSRGRPQRARRTAFHNGWSLIKSPLIFSGKTGDYTYQAFHGPRFSPASGGFSIFEDGDGVDIVRLPAHCNLQREGWFGGDLLSQTSAEKTKRWLNAEDLQMSVAVAKRLSARLEPSTLPPNFKNEPWIENYSYHDDRSGSGLVLHHWMPPAEVPADLPSSRLLTLAKNSGKSGTQGLPVHAEIQRLWARDVPVWLASQRIDSIQVLSEHLTYDGKGAVKSSPLIDPEPGRFRGTLGPGRIVEFLYWQVLETGLQIPPSAGSGFGPRSNPLGYNRVYTKPEELTVESWWEALREGKSFVSNGPLLRARVNGQPPGHKFSSPNGSPLEIEVALTLTVADPVQYLDVIYNGQTLYQARLDEYAKQGGKIPALPVDQSGWVVIRVLTERDHTYRLATTAPYYFQIGDKPRISRKAVEYFQAWLAASAVQIEKAGHLAKHKPYLTAARKFWQQKLDSATAP